MPSRAVLTSALLSLPLVSCQGGLGTVPVALIELADMAEPQGRMELDVGRDGTVHLMDVDIPLAALPAAVRDAALHQAPQGLIIGAERELQSAGRVWVVRLKYDGRNWEYVIDGSGAVVEVCKELRGSETPEVVTQSAERVLPGGTHGGVEQVTRGEETEYRVKKSIGGATYKVVLTPAGEVLRRVREAVCEVEIPLR